MTGHINNQLLYVYNIFIWNLTPNVQVSHSSSIVLVDFFSC